MQNVRQILTTAKKARATALVKTTNGETYDFIFDRDCKTWKITHRLNTHDVFELERRSITRYVNTMEPVASITLEFPSTQI